MKQYYSLQARRQYRWPIMEWPILVWIKIFFGDKRIRDRDNRHKISMDCLIWIVVKDDSQLDCMWVYRMYDKNNPRIELDFLPGKDNYEDIEFVWRD